MRATNARSAAISTPCVRFVTSLWTTRPCSGTCTARRHTRDGCHGSPSCSTAPIAAASCRMATCERLGGIDSVHKIMRALPEVREPFWKTFVEVAKTNPGALRYIVMLMALYMHLGPFSKHVISEIERRIAELDRMSPVRATGVTRALLPATV